jgi:hypothetical protein
MSEVRKMEEKAFTLLAACYMNELESDSCAPRAERLQREDLLAFDPDRMLTHLTAAGETLLDCVLERVYSYPLAAETAVLRALNICCEEINQSDREEIQDLLRDDFLIEDEYSDEYEERFALSECSFASAFQKLYPESDLRIVNPEKVVF